PGLVRRQPAGGQVDQRVRVELADGRAVRGLHLVGVDHQHRLGVDLGGGREQQVLVRQACVGAVGVIVDGDAAVEDHAPAAGADAAPQPVGAGCASDVL